MLINNRMEHFGVQVSNKCNLNCKYCADLCNYRPKDDYILEDIVADMEKVISVVDGIDEFLICGGETLLYRDLVKLVDYIGRLQKVKKMIITTNGTIIPKDELVQSMLRNKVMLRISGYDKEVAPNRDKIIEMIKGKIEIQDLAGMKWYDIGANFKRNRTSEQLTDIFSKCGMKGCIGLSKGMIIFCSRQMTAVETDIYPNPIEQEVLSVRNIGVHELKTALDNFYNQRFISTCDYCDGIDMSNPELMESRRVPVAEQIK